jgi:hypothetical protein
MWAPKNIPPGETSCRGTNFPTPLIMIVALNIFFLTGSPLQIFLLNKKNNETNMIALLLPFIS